MNPKTVEWIFIALVLAGVMALFPLMKRVPEYMAAYHQALTPATIPAADLPETTPAVVAAPPPTEAPKEETAPPPARVSPQPDNSWMRTRCIKWGECPDG